MNKINTKMYRDGKLLTGDEIIRYHRQHGTASYHCYECGMEITDIVSDNPCRICKHNHGKDQLNQVNFNN